MQRFAAGVLLSISVAECGGAPIHTRQAASAKASHVEIDRFLSDEERLLTLVAAADARVAARGIRVDSNTFHHAAIASILVEDATLGMDGNRPDVFSFDARARALDAAAQVLARWATPPDDPDPASSGEPALELELLRRFVASEKLRLAYERKLPHSASTLLAATVATWQPLEAKEASTRDDWLSKRLREVASSLEPKALTALERDELDDALDPLERIVGDGLPQSRAALVTLRIALQRADPAEKQSDRWLEVSARLAADTGSTQSAETLLALFGAEAKAIHDEIGRLVGVEPTQDVSARASEWLLAPPETCRTTPAGSRLRALEPPPERSFECALRSRIISARTASEELDVLVAMHTAVMTAAWAVVFARGGTDETSALASPKPLAPISPTVEGHLRRLAAVHPVETISRALSIHWLIRNGFTQAAPRAETWRAFGDAPLDIIDRRVQPPTEKRPLPHTPRP